MNNQKTQTDAGAANSDSLPLLVMPFGRHKGKSLWDCPIAYLRTLRRNVPIKSKRLASEIDAMIQTETDVSWGNEPMTHYDGDY